MKKLLITKKGTQKVLIGGGTRKCSKIKLVTYKKLHHRSNKRNTIYVYQDKGVSHESIVHTISSLQRLRKKYLIKTINAQQVRTGSWIPHASLFIMPGGADLPYLQKLQGKGNQFIQEYVTNGGSFLGICAGSYYGSSYVEFDKHGPLEVIGKRELRFFPGKAIGPVLAPYQYDIPSGSRAAMIYTNSLHIKKTLLFYNGGGFFENASKYPNTQIIGTYANHLPAIILIHHAKGKVLLSGVHFEYNPHLLNRKDRHIIKIIKPLCKSNVSRKILFKNIMQLLGLK